MGQMGKCVCGQRIDLGNISATGTVTCPGCGRVLKVRKHPEPAPQSNRMCPWCRQSVPAEATVCGNCGLDFSTGLRTAGASKTNHFLVRTLFSFRKNFLTARQLILLAVGCVVVISPFFFLRSRPPVEIYEILPAETFIALNNIDAYPPVHKPKGPRGKEVRIGFVSSGMKLPDALKVFNEPGTDLPKNLYLFRKADDGEYLMVRLGISQKFLMDHNAGDKVVLRLDNENIQLHAGGKATFGLLLDPEYSGCADAGMNTAFDADQCLPSGFDPKREENSDPNSIKTTLTYSGTQEKKTFLSEDEETATTEGEEKETAKEEEPVFSPEVKGTLAGRVEFRGKPSSSHHGFAGLMNVPKDPEEVGLTGLGELLYKSPTGMAAKYKYQQSVLTLTWDKATRCGRGGSTALQTRFVFGSSKWDLWVLFPRPKAGTRNMELKVFDKTFKISDRYAANAGRK